MLVMKVAPIEFVGIIASIITAVIFAFVLGFQIKATNAARRAADAATASADQGLIESRRIRPNVFARLNTIHPDPSAPKSITARVGIENSGLTTAYDLDIKVRILPNADVRLREISTFSGQDLPTGEVKNLDFALPAELTFETFDPMHKLELEVLATYKRHWDDKEWLMSHQTFIPRLDEHANFTGEWVWVKGDLDRPMTD